jgi:2-oxo-4-hydroxy-4-carboxy-5-ureidoimidazoline decarboxylase
VVAPLTDARAGLDLPALNAAPDEPLARWLSTCAPVPRWVQALIDGRPYPDVATLLARADVLARGWTEPEVLGALDHHPRIGERSAAADREAALSASEQSGLQAGADAAERLRAGNTAYEARFGHIFLIRAAGRSAAEILHELDRRLANDPDAELTETAGQVREIALLRLRAAVADGSVR